MRIILPCFLLLLCTLPIATGIAQSSTLPLLRIDTDAASIVDEPKITARLTIAGDYDGFIGIEIRGSSSQTFPKKGFGIETRDANGNDVDASILGMPEEEDWVLHGPYSDKSLIRNALAYELAGEIMDYTPRVRMVELEINGDYRGVYLFTEKIKRDKHRVNVSKLNEDENSGDDLTGGYLLKIDKATAESTEVPFSFESLYNGDTERDNTVNILFDYPKPEDITTTQRGYIEDWMHHFERTLNGDDFLDPVVGYRPMVDLESFVNFLIINELSRNVDGYRISTWMYKDKDSKGGKLHMGPVWDFNLAFGNAYYCSGESVAGWGYDFGQACPGDFWQLPFWWGRLREDPEFSSLLSERWNAYRSGIFSDQRLMTKIDSLVGLIGPAANRNFSRWPVLDEYVWPNVVVEGTYAGEITYLKNWLLERTAWMDGQIGEITSLHNSIPAEQLLLYPNPSDGIFRMDRAAVARIDYLTVVDALGREVYSRAGPRNIEREIDLTGVPAGIYHLQAWTRERKVLISQLVRR